MPKAAAKPKSTQRKDPLKATSGNTSKAKKATKGKRASASKPTAEANQARTSSNPSDWNYLILVGMLGTFDPMVERLLSLPPTMTFAQLHETLQIAFGWANCHMHTFEVSRSDEGPYSRPFMRLVRTVFDMKIAGFDQQEDAKWTLADVFEKPDWKGKVRVNYTYDQGDNWEHDLCVLGRQEPSSWEQMSIPSDMKAVCLSGSGHPVAEDCGSTEGWIQLKDLFERPKTKDEDDRKGWFKKHCMNADPKGLNPHRWDKLQVNGELSDLTL